MYEVCAGGDAKEVERRRIVEMAMIMMGGAGKWFPLNGSSEDRQDLRAALYCEARNLRVNFAASGCHAVVGGRPWEKGNRYLTSTSSRHRELRWVHWRKAKRLIRKKQMRSAELAQESAGT